MVTILLTILFSTYPWPIRQFGSAHPVSATLGDARGDSLVDPRFHRGIDIPAGIGKKVYSIISDTARWGGSGVNTYVRVGDYWYIHIDNRTKQDSFVLGILDTINTPPDTIGKVLDYPNGDHLHFQIGPSGGPYENPLSHDGGPVGYDDTDDPTIKIDFWRQGSEGITPQILQSPLSDTVDIRAYCQDVQTSGGSNQNSGIYSLEWSVRNVSTSDISGPFQTTIFPQVQPPDNGDSVLLVYDRHHYRIESPFYYWATNPIINHTVEDRYWNTKQHKDREWNDPPADSIEDAEFPDGDYWVKVYAYDIRENADSESVSVKIANFRPKVKETEPDNGEEHVPIHKTIYVRFSEDMDQTIDLRSAIAIDPGVNGDWEWLNTKSILFTPDPAYVVGTTYLVSLSSALKDLQGQTLIPYSFAFTTDTTEDVEFYPTKPQWEGNITWWDVSVDWFYNYYASQMLGYFEFPFYGYSYSILIFNRRGSIWFETNHDLAHFDLPSSGGTGDPVIAVYNDSLRHLFGGYSRGRSRELFNPKRELLRWTYAYGGDTTEFEAVLFEDGKIVLNYLKCDIDSFYNDAGSGISKGDTAHYSSITDAYGPVYELAPGQFTWPGSYVATEDPPPGFPRDLDTTEQQRSEHVTLVWRSNPEPDLMGYCIYRSETSYQYEDVPYDTVWRPDTTYTDSSPMPGTNYYAATAFDSAGYESRYSNEVEVLAADVYPPTAPYVKQAEKSDSNVVLIWNKITTDTLGFAETVEYYVVYRDTTPDFVPSSSDSIGAVVQPDTVYTDTGALNTSGSYYYLVMAVDSASNKSKKSNMGYKLNKFFNENASRTDNNWMSSQ